MEIDFTNGIASIFCIFVRKSGSGFLLGFKKNETSDGSRSILYFTIDNTMYFLLSKELFFLSIPIISSLEI